VRADPGQSRLVKAGKGQSRQMAEIETADFADRRGCSGAYARAGAHLQGEDLLSATIRAIRGFKDSPLPFGAGRPGICRGDQPQTCAPIQAIKAGQGG
jgi:hypothetical protein